MEPKIFRYLGGSLESAIGEFIAPALDAIVSVTSVLAGALVMLYVAGVGILIVLGYVEQPAKAFAGKSLKLVIIMSIAISAGTYGSVVGDTVASLEALLGEALGARDAAGGIYAVLDETFGSGMSLAMRCFEAADNASWRAFGSIIGWVAVGLLLVAGSVLVVLIGGGVIVVAKFALALLVAVGPLFLMALMFPPVARFFDQWGSSVVNYLLLGVFVILVMSFATVVFTGYVSKANLSGEEGAPSPIMIAGEMLLLVGLLVWLALQTQSWAASLSGGMATSVMTLRHMAQPGAWLGEGAGAARSIANPVSTRRDMESGVPYAARRSRHLVLGNTVANPAYYQHMRGQIGKHWGMPKGGAAQRV